MTELYVFVSVVLVSLLSIVGALVLVVSTPFLNKILLFLVAFSTGALLGDAFLHLLPEAVENEGRLTEPIALAVFVGLLSFFMLEKFLRWQHCHDMECSEHKYLGIMNLVGDGVHNLIDGLLIGASYLASLALGIATTAAVAAHEIPQELGDFGVLLHSGFKPLTALFYNFLSALLAVAGAGLALWLGRDGAAVTAIIIPVTAGGFIYIALSGLVPELHKESGVARSILQLGAMLLGLYLMYALLGLE